MADILIRGMEMPTQDALLHIHADGRAVFYPFCILDEVTEYEAIKLPEHGDLISKPALFDEVFKVWGVEYAESDCNTLMDLINDAPVVIPANKEETE